MNNFTVNSIGRVRVSEEGFCVELDKKYIPALQGLDGFSYVQVFWWFDGCDNEASRSSLTVNKPYKKGPEVMGTFATRSPERPNPIALTPAYVTGIDHENGIIYLAYIDAFDNTPVLDIKPYTPSLDRVENPEVPDWCSHWPESNEESGEFDWESEFNF
ncbi:MAG: SAM-dependent methyltransferase [Oscillospiraceae bacterium]|nr:SAM-dependent methyltransferase [Oscillospiraceae bacterium]